MLLKYSLGKYDLYYIDDPFFFSKYIKINQNRGNF